MTCAKSRQSIMPPQAGHPCNALLLSSVCRQRVHRCSGLSVSQPLEPSRCINGPVYRRVCRIPAFAPCGLSLVQCIASSLVRLCSPSPLVVLHRPEPRRCSVNGARSVAIDFADAQLPPVRVFVDHAVVGLREPVGRRTMVPGRLMGVEPGRELRRPQSQSASKPNGASASSQILVGSRVPFWAAVIMRLARTSLIMSGCPVSFSALQAMSKASLRDEQCPAQRARP